MRLGIPLADQDCILDPASEVALDISVGRLAVPRRVVRPDDRGELLRADREVLERILAHGRLLPARIPQAVDIDAHDASPVRPSLLYLIVDPWPLRRPRADQYDEARLAAHLAADPAHHRCPAATLNCLPLVGS